MLESLKLATMLTYYLPEMLAYAIRYIDASEVHPAKKCSTGFLKLCAFARTGAVESEYGTRAYNMLTVAVNELKLRERNA